jgi:hypothetical protein
VSRVDVLDRRRKYIGTEGSAGKPGGGETWKVDGGAMEVVELGGTL